MGGGQEGDEDEGQREDPALRALQRGGGAVERAGPGQPGCEGGGRVGGGGGGLQAREGGQQGGWVGP